MTDPRSASPNDSRLARLADAAAQTMMRRALAVFAGSLLATALILYYVAGNLGVNTDTSGMISTDSVTEASARNYKKAFPQYEGNLTVVVTAKTPEAARRAARELESRMAKDAKHFSLVYNPAGGDFFEKNGFLFFDEKELEDLSNSVAKAQPFLAKLSKDPSLRGMFSLMAQAVEEIAKGRSFDLAPVLAPMDASMRASLEGRNDPLSWQQVMQGDSGLYDERYQYIMAKPVKDESATLPVKPAFEAVRAHAADLQTDPGLGVRVRITGEEALGLQEIETVLSSIGLVTFLSVALVFFILWIALRSFRLLFATTVTLIMGLVVTAGFAAVAIGSLNMVSVAFAVYYIGLGVTHSIHVCLRYRELILAGLPSPEAIRGAVRDTAPSLILCSITTAIGFFAFIGTSFAGVSELGLISGVGMFLSMVISLTVLPAILTLMPLSAPKRAAAPLLGGFFDSLKTFPTRHARAICWGASALGVASLFLVPHAFFDYDPINLRDPESESVSTLREIVAKSGAGSQWGVAAVAPTLEEAKSRVERLSKLESVGRAMSIASFVPEGQEEKLPMIEDLALMVGPETLHPEPVPPPSTAEQLAALREFDAKIEPYLKSGLSEKELAAAQSLRATVRELLAKADALQGAEQAALLARAQEGLLGFLPDSLASLAKALDATPFTLDDLPADLRSRWISADGQYRIEAAPTKSLDDSASLRGFVRQVLEVAPNATDASITILASGDAVIKAFREASAYALLAIFILLLFVFRNLRDAMLVMVPVLLAAVFTGAATALLKEPFNFANLIALPLLLGVGVDNGVHIVQKMRMGASGAVEPGSVSGAVFYSALTTLAAFTNLSFASHPGMASLGRIHSISISFGLLCVLVVLPALVARVQPAEAAAVAEPNPTPEVEP